MYDIVKDIRNCRLISVSDFGNTVRAEEYYTKGVQIDVYSHHSQFPTTDEFIEEVSHIYNNLTLHNDKFELQILQDYGQGCIGIPGGYEMIPQELMEETFNSNIGWFNGYLSLIYLVGDVLYVDRLIEIPKIDLDHIRDKRPYSYFLCAKDKEVYIAIYINYWIAPDYKMIDNHLYLIPTHRSLDVLLSVSNIYAMLDTILINSQGNEWRSTENKGKRFITRDWLIRNKWNFNDGIWSKNGTSIIDECDETPYFKQNGDYIFYIEDIKYENT